MKKTLAAIVMVCLVGVSAAAQESGKSGNSLAQWLKGIQKKIAKLVPRNEEPLTTTVAGVRGAKEGGQRRLYWKGKAGEEPVTAEELGKFRECVDVAAKGDNPAAVQQLEAFMKQYPDSALIPDAKKTMDMLRAGSAPNP